eukprot:12405334-Karenia_brevis.AAC.1
MAARRVVNVSPRTFGNRYVSTTSCASCSTKTSRSCQKIELRHPALERVIVAPLTYSAGNKP